MQCWTSHFFQNLLADITATLVGCAIERKIVAWSQNQSLDDAKPIISENCSDDAKKIPRLFSLDQEIGGPEVHHHHHCISGFFGSSLYASGNKGDDHTWSYGVGWGFLPRPPLKFLPPPQGFRQNLLTKLQCKLILTPTTDYDP
jgi:hypothetical protein